MPTTQREVPPARYIDPDMVMDVMAEHGYVRLQRLDAARVLALAVLAGAFITSGALFSVLLATGASTEGTVHLLEGLGFSAGFFFVILSGAVLFTEANVVLPAVLRRQRNVAARVARFWALAFVGNLAGAALCGVLIGVAIDLTPGGESLLAEIVDRKTAAAGGGVGDWLAVVVSGFLANWLVGMAAFFATMGRTITGKYVPVLLAVTLFVSAGFQHSPANMGFFSLQTTLGGGLDLREAVLWNLLPAGLGNILGGGLAVAALLGWAHGERQGTTGPSGTGVMRSGLARP